jgi:1-acyl-sn-glycerol-3-phosphate acyltransferase
MSLLLLSTTGKGFVHVATQARVPIVPTFLANQEEMRWNPAQCLWNLFRLGRLFSYIIHLNIPVLTPLLAGIGMGAWFSTTWIQIPIPAKLTLYIGDPVSYDMSKDSIEDVSHAA